MYTGGIAYQFNRQRNIGVKVVKLDGLRGVASLVVVFSHIFLWFIPSAHYGEPGPLGLGKYLFNAPVSFFYRGDFAVYLFFILSGLVLTYSLQRNKHSLCAIRKAALKRYLRLGIPVAASVFICYLLMVLNTFHVPDVEPLADLAKNYTFDESFSSAAQDALFGALLLGDSKYNYVLWTINIEFLGSLAIFSLIALFGTRERIYQGACLVVIVLLLASTRRLYFCIGLFFVGSMLATLKFPAEPGRGAKAASMALLAIGLYLAGFHAHSASYAWIEAATDALSRLLDRETPWHMAIPALGAALIIIGVLLSGKVLAVLESAALRWIGRLSFSIYLLHSVILAVCAQVAIAYWGLSYLSFAMAAAMTFVLTIGAAHMFYLKVDAPAVALSARFADWVLLRSAQPASYGSCRLPAHRPL